MEIVLVARPADNPWVEVADKVMLELISLINQHNWTDVSLMIQPDLNYVYQEKDETGKVRCVILHPWSWHNIPIVFSTEMPAKYLVLVSGGLPPFFDPVSEHLKRSQNCSVIECERPTSVRTNFCKWLNFWRKSSYSKDGFLMSQSILRDGACKEVMAARHLRHALNIILGMSDLPTFELLISKNPVNLVDIYKNQISATIAELSKSPPLLTYIDERFPGLIDYYRRFISMTCDPGTERYVLEEAIRSSSKMKAILDDYVNNAEEV